MNDPVAYKHCHNLPEWYYDEANTLTESECREVLDILLMFEPLKDTYDTLDDKTGIEEWRVNFSGFDGNHETERLGYTRYFVGLRDRYTGYDKNSHCPMLERYQKMLADP